MEKKRTVDSSGGHFSNTVYMLQDTVWVATRKYYYLAKTVDNAQTTSKNASE